MSWIDDPKLARRLARVSWVVLVTAAVVLTRLSLEPSYERLALAALLAVLVVLNAPVVNGLLRTRAEAHTAPWRAVAGALLMRATATAGVIAWVSVS